MVSGFILNITHKKDRTGRGRQVWPFLMGRRNYCQIENIPTVDDVQEIIPGGPRSARVGGPKKPPLDGG